MPLVSVSIVPHSPLLLPTIDKAVQKKIARTRKAYAALAADLKAKSIDTVIIIAPRPARFQPTDAFCIHLPATYRGDFTEFGDLTTTVELVADHMLAGEIKTGAAEHGLPTIYNSEERIDYEASIPLLMLEKSGITRGVIINPCTRVMVDHAVFGRALRDIAQSSDRRIAVLISGELSHRLTADSPAGIWKGAKDFDKKLLCILQEHNLDAFLSLAADELKEAQSCGIESFAIGLGLMQDLKHETDLKSYEGPLGIGYAVLEYQL